MTTPAPRLMAKKEYAGHRKVTPAMVSHWTKAGRIVIVDGRVDVAASDAMLAASLDPARGGKGGKSKHEPTAPEDLGFGESSSYTRVRTVTEQYRAKQAEINYRKAVGELVERARMETALANIIGTIRRGMQKLPDVLAARLAAEPDPRKARAMLVTEIEQMLADLSGAVEALPEQLTATQQ